MHLLLALCELSFLFALTMTNGHNFSPSRPIIYDSLSTGIHHNTPLKMLLQLLHRIKPFLWFSSHCCLFQFLHLSVEMDLCLAFKCWVRYWDTFTLYVHFFVFTPILSLLFFYLVMSDGDKSYIITGTHWHILSPELFFRRREEDCYFETDINA